MSRDRPSPSTAGVGTVRHPSLLPLLATIIAVLASVPTIAGAPASAVAVGPPPQPPPPVPSPAPSVEPNPGTDDPPVPPTPDAEPSPTPPAAPPDDGPRPPQGDGRTEQGQFDFTAMHDEDPVGWDPCRPIPYVVYTPNLPDGGRAGISRVLDEVTDISGIRFEEVGTTDDAETGTSSRLDHAMIGWVAYDDAAAWQRFDRDQVAGLGGGRHRGRYRVGGFAIVRADLESVNDADERGLGVLRHEVGHLLGLAHVPDEDTLMFGEANDVTTWSSGDRQGLRELASIPCAVTDGLSSLLPGAEPNVDVMPAQRESNP